MTPRAKIEESDLDDVFGAVDAEPLATAEDFELRVESEIGAVSLPSSTPPNALRIAVSALVQTANVVLGSLCISPRRTPTDKSSATPTGPTDS